MIKFFRHIRLNLMEKGKTSKYLKYAIGEIVLVVIGILIALQINNWNEQRKINQSIKASLASLIVDLKQDVVELNANINMIDEDYNRVKHFINRLSKPAANIDTLKKIARYEYLPFFDPSNELNRNTIQSLLSSGKIENFENDLKNSILNHNSDQKRSIRIMDQNITIYLNNQAKYPEFVAIQSENKRLDDFVIRGHLLEKHWQTKGNNILLDGMLNTLTSKLLMYYIVRNQKNILLEKTTNMIKYLENQLKKY